MKREIENGDKINEYSEHYLKWKNADIKKYDKLLQKYKKDLELLELKLKSVIKTKNEKRTIFEKSGYNKIETNKLISPYVKSIKNIENEIEKVKKEIKSINKIIEGIYIVQNEEQSIKKINKLIEKLEKNPKNIYKIENELRKYLSAFIYNENDTYKRINILFIKDLYNSYGLDFIKKNNLDTLIELFEFEKQLFESLYYKCLINNNIFTLDKINHEKCLQYAEKETKNKLLNFYEEIKKEPKFNFVVSFDKKENIYLSFIIPKLAYMLKDKNYNKYRYELLNLKTGESKIYKYNDNESIKITKLKNI